MSRTEPPRVAALVTWFRPGPEALLGLADAREQCDAVVVVDNTPAGEPSLPAPDGVVLRRDGVNRGLAAALNEACRHVPANYDAVLLLDQDSRLPPQTVARLAEHLDDPSVGAASPAPWDEAGGRFLDPRTRRRPAVADLPVAITSGLLVRRAVLEEVGPFRVDFFVDAVDQDFCLRLRSQGHRLVQDRMILLPHRLGDVSWHRVLGVQVRSTNHPRWRLYSAARNSVRLSREHFRTEPRWAVTNLALVLAWLVTVLLFEPPRVGRGAAMLRGALDGWRGRSGPVRPA